MKSAELESALKWVIQKYVDPSETYVFLFGSRAGGRNKPASDYDIGLYQERQIPLSVIAKIKDEIEDYPIPVDVDLVDFNAVSDDFKKLALKGIRLWNIPKKSFKLI